MLGRLRFRVPNPKLLGDPKMRKLQHIQYLRGQDVFDPSKTPFLDVLPGPSRKKYLKIQKSIFIVFKVHFFKKNLNWCLGRRIWETLLQKFYPYSKLFWGRENYASFLTFRACPLFEDPWSPLLQPHTRVQQIWKDILFEVQRKNRHFFGFCHFGLSEVLQIRNFWPNTGVLQRRNIKNDEIWSNLKKFLNVTP